MSRMKRWGQTWEKVVRFSHPHALIRNGKTEAITQSPLIGTTTLISATKIGSALPR